MRKGKREKSRKKLAWAPIESRSSFINLTYISLRSSQDFIFFITSPPR
jgi:hypothetical protein